MTSKEIAGLVAAAALDAVVEPPAGQPAGQPALTVTVPAGGWLALLALARDQLGCDFFDWLGAVDEAEAGVAVLTHVYSLAGRHHLLLRTVLDGDPPRLATATGVYRGAAWHERETHEMFGVVFDGHPWLGPLLLPDGFEGHPLRKDFPLAARAAQEWPGAREPGEPGRPRPPAARPPPGGAAGRTRGVAGRMNAASGGDPPVSGADFPVLGADLPARSRGVIGLLEENCTVCMLCARECPDWCIYIESHKEPTPAEPGTAPRRGGRQVRNALDRFAIDFSLCMYCGICIEVCPYDALFWSPEFSYAETDILELTHERGRLREWMWTVPPPPAHDPGAPVPKEIQAVYGTSGESGVSGRAGVSGEPGPGEQGSNG